MTITLRCDLRHRQHDDRLGEHESHEVCYSVGNKSDNDRRARRAYQAPSTPKPRQRNGKMPTRHRERRIFVTDSAQPHLSSTKTPAATDLVSAQRHPSQQAPSASSVEQEDTRRSRSRAPDPKGLTVLRPERLCYSLPKAISLLLLLKLCLEKNCYSTPSHRVSKRRA